MAEYLTVVRPYAKAAFMCAVEENSVDKWQSMLCAMALACQEPNVMAAIKNAPNAGGAEEILISLLHDVIDDECKNLIHVLGENNRFEAIHEIYEEFLRLREQHDKVLEVQFVVAHPYAQEEIEALKSKLAAKYGCSIKFKQITDASLIGGAILKVGNEVIDASVKAGIESLSSTLK